MDIKKYVEKVLEISSKTIKIKKNTWFKDLSNEKIIVNNSIVDMTKEMGLMLKLIFYFDYISDINLRTITLPILPDNRYKNYIKIMKSMKLIKEYKRGLGKIFYQLGTNGFDILSDKEFYQRNVSSKKNSLSGRANATIEDNDLRAAYLGEKVLAACNNRFIEILDEYSEEEKNGYILNLFIQNISFDLMLKEITSNPDMQNHLSNLGFTEKEEIQFFSVRGYNQTIRRKYCNKVQIKMLGEDYVPLGYEQYFQSYKEYITKTENVFERFYFLCQLQELDSFDYFSLVTDTIKSCINGNEDSGNSSNLIKFQTEEVRNRLLFLLEEMAKRNGDNVKESNKLKLDAKIYKLNNDISIYNAIISNLKRMEKALRSNKESSPEEYTTIVSFIEAYSNLREKIQEEYSKVRRYLEFNDPLSKRSADNPLIALYELERKNVLISDIIPKRNKKTGRCYLQIDLVKIDREKNIENFNSFQQRRDYFGPKEFFDVISMETGVDIKISYTYCYPEGSRILNYEERLNKIFTNKGLSNTNMKAPDYFYIHKIENRLSLEEYMTRLNKTILG